MAQLRFLYNIFCQALIDLPNSNDKNAFLYSLEKENLDLTDAVHFNSKLFKGELFNYGLLL